MRRLNTIIIISTLITLFSACVFSIKDEDRVLFVENTERHTSLTKPFGDSITVSTIIDNFRLYYKISEVTDESQRPGKEILMNIQTLDMKNVVSNKNITISDFCSSLDILSNDDCFIDLFYLKEVKKDSVIFGAEICRFSEDARVFVELRIGEDGAICYSDGSDR